MRISVVGLGKLGSPLAAVLASKGHKVIGMDLNPEFVRLLNQGRAPVQEPRLQELIDASKGRLRATGSIEEATLESEINFVIVPTPSDSKGAYRTSTCVEAVDRDRQSAAQEESYHVVNITMHGHARLYRGRDPASTGRRFGTNVVGKERRALLQPGSPSRSGAWSATRCLPDAILVGESDPRRRGICWRAFTGRAATTTLPFSG